MKLIINLTLALILLNGCSPTDEEKEAAFKEFFVSGIYFSDTIMEYTLDTNQLVLEFPTPTKFKTWNMQVYLINSKTGDDTLILDDNYAAIENNKVVCSKFNIPIDEIGDYSPIVFACPNPNDTNFIFISDPRDVVKNKYSKKDSTKMLLQCWRPNRKYVMVNFDLLDEMHPEVRNYCLQKFRKFFKIGSKLPEGVNEIE